MICGPMNLLEIGVYVGKITVETYRMLEPYRHLLVQSSNGNVKQNINDFVLVPLYVTFNRFQTLFTCLGGILF